MEFTVNRTRNLIWVYEVEAGVYRFVVEFYRFPHQRGIVEDRSTGYRTNIPKNWIVV